MLRVKILGLMLFIGVACLHGLATAEDTYPPDTGEGYILKGNIQWDEDKARNIALRHLERQVDLQWFKSKDERYFDRMREKLQDPNVKFVNQQVTWFDNGAYSVAYEGQNMVHYYHENGELFKVSVCSKPFGDTWDYPRRCIDYAYPEGKFLTVSMDVSPEESYVFDLKGSLLEHWKDDQGFSQNEDTNWTRWSDRDSNTPETQPNSLPSP